MGMFDEVQEGVEESSMIDISAMKRGMSTEDSDDTDAAEFVPDTQPLSVATTPNHNPTQTRERVVELKNLIGKSYAEMCEHLWNIQQHSWYQNWGFSTFRDYVNKELEFKASKAMYLASIWKNLYVNQNDDVFHKVVDKLPWYKAKELSRIVTKENVDDWVEKATHLSTDDLIKEVKSELKSKVPDEPSDALANEGQVQGTPVAEQTKYMNIAFQYEDYLTLCTLLEYVEKEFPGTTKGRAIAMAAQELLSTAGGSTGRDLIVATAKKLDDSGAPTGIRLVVIDQNEKKVLHGFDVLKEVLAEETEETSVEGA